MTWGSPMDWKDFHELRDEYSAMRDCLTQVSPVRSWLNPGTFTMDGEVTDVTMDENGECTMETLWKHCGLFIWIVTVIKHDKTTIWYMWYQWGHANHEKSMSISNFTFSWHKASNIGALWHWLFQMANRKVHGTQKIKKKHVNQTNTCFDILPSTMPLHN